MKFNKMNVNALLAVWVIAISLIIIFTPHKYDDLVLIVFGIISLSIILARKDVKKDKNTKDKYEKVLKLFGIKDIGEFSDGYHTFNSLYDQKLILFAALVKCYKDKAWKSRRHEDLKKCFGGGWFIVGIETPEGQYTYHFEDKYWYLFNCKELECSPKFDGHTDKDVRRLLSL